MTQELRGVMAEIRNLLDEGFSVADLEADGYKRSTIYQVRRKLRLGQRVIQSVNSASRVEGQLESLDRRLATVESLLILMESHLKTLLPSSTYDATIEDLAASIAKRVASQIIPQRFTPQNTPENF